jgi:hypothetical protein
MAWDVGDFATAIAGLVEWVATGQK